MVGLVLAALAVGYFLLTGRFTSNSTRQIQNEVSEVASTPAPTLQPATPSAIGSTTRRDIRVLPRTGSPLISLGIIALGVMVSGLSLRKFPK